ncbi:MAG: ParB N-terminal domain-containing protein [Treponema sp.]|jgi:ParB family chromosome partitioning protein|nr:ParB N-terminal domain-containing protein [Treponema sp.]
MLVPIEDIKVKKRIRKEMGDISALAESLKRFGQISPIVITKKNVLVAGGRRLEAARTLGWRTINAVIAEIPDEVTKLEYELEENIQRRDFSREEEEEAVRRITKLRNPSLFRRIINAIVRFFRRLFRIED